MPDRQRRGILVTFSGIDGAGKTTQIRLLQERLAKQGVRSRYLRSRGGYTSGFKRLKSCLRRHVRGALPPPGHSPKRERQFKRRWVQAMWLILAILDLMRVYALQIRQWLRRGDVVICDRYIWDTLIDFQINFPKVKVEHWWLWRALAWSAPQPAASFLLIVSPQESERRALAKGDPFPDPWERRKKRYNLYHHLSEQDQVFDVVDASASIEHQHEYIYYQVQLRLGGDHE